MAGKDTEILLTLLENNNMTFNQLHEATGISKRILRKHLDKLIKDGTVHEEGRRQFQKHKGMKLQYRLTRKGERYTLDLVLSEVGGALKGINRLISRLNEPEQLSKLREYLYEANKALILDSEYEKLRKGEVSQKEMLDRFNERVNKSSGLLTKTFRDFHRLFIQTKLPKEKRDRGYYIGFPENSYGGPVFIDEKLHDKWNKEAELWRKQQMKESQR